MGPGRDRTRTKTLSELELAVMLAVARVGEAGYSVSIRRDIEEHTGRRLSRGALYVTLDRLCQKGLLDSWKGAPTPERGGRAKRHYRPTAAGRRAVQASREALQQLFAGSDWAGEDA